MSDIAFAFSFDDPDFEGGFSVSCMQIFGGVCSSVAELKKALPTDLAYLQTHTIYACVNGKKVEYRLKKIKSVPSEEELLSLLGVQPDAKISFSMKFDDEVTHYVDVPCDYSDVTVEELLWVINKPNNFPEDFSTLDFQIDEKKIDHTTEYNLGEFNQKTIIVKRKQGDMGGDTKGE